MDIIIYTANQCPECKRVKEFFKINKIKFIEVDIGMDQKAAKEMIEKSGQMSIPVIDVGGKIVVGFNKMKLKEVLNLK